MLCTKQELLEYFEENDVKFVKLTFCDMLGRQRNISVLSSQLEDAFEHGVAIDSSAVTGVGGVDLKLKPVPSLLSDLPWRPHSGKAVSVFCNIFNDDCTPYACDPMSLLEAQVAKLAELGYTASVSTECEFYVFKDDGGNTPIPIDNGDYCSCAPFDKCENLRRDVILSLEDMGLKPISSHHERGCGQNEIDFERADPRSAARNFIMFKAAVKNVCALTGTRASFMPKPISTQPGSGLHFTVSLSGANASKASAAFAEGVMRRYKEITCFANPTVNSYKRIGKSYKIGYASDRSAAVRYFNDKEVQLRTPDSTCNPFTVLTLIFAAGREGIEKGYKLREKGNSGECLFNDFGQAIEFAKNSEWLHEIIPHKLDDVLNTMHEQCKAAQTLLTDEQFFEFYSDI